MQTKCGECQKNCICSTCKKCISCRYSTQEDCKVCVECGMYEQDDFIRALSKMMLHRPLELRALHSFLKSKQDNAKRRN